MTDTGLWAVKNSIPDHVPADLVDSFDFYGTGGVNRCPFATVSRLSNPGRRIFYNTNDPQCGASWVLTNAEDFRTVLGDPDLFSSRNIAGFSALLGEAWPLLPVEVDPPAHKIYRSILNPPLAPPAIAKLSDGIRQRAVDLIDSFAGDGGCEFMGAFGSPFPVSVILQLIGLPDDMTPQFLAWEHDLLANPDIQAKVAAATAIKAYLTELMEERRKHPTDDLAGQVVTTEIDGRKLTDDEVMGIYFLLFVGGLDTVASSLGFYFQHLAEHPEAQARLRADPSIIPRAAEEFVRAFSPVTTRRIATRDTELAGVTIKQGDWVTLVTALASLDPELFDDPRTVDFDRKNSRHLGFAYGPHFCVGSNLARREIHIALEEWMARIPPFSIKPGSSVRAHGGPVMGLEELHLVW
jgi:cytochrome P450